MTSAAFAETSFRRRRLGDDFLMSLECAVGDRVHRVEDAFTNWYIVEEGDAVTVVDTGHPRSWRSLQQALAELGRRTAEVEAVVVTHCHFDHMGFAERARRAGIPVFVPDGDLELARHPVRYDHERSRLRYMLRHPGFDRAFAAMAAMGALFVRPLAHARGYGAKEPLDVPGRPRPIATPGHTHGHTALQLEDRGVLIAGDAFVTYNPYTASAGPQIVSGGATADSAQALSSLEAFEGLEAEVTLTGHGPPWRGSPQAAVERAHSVGPS
jgi:glyoxylase-like metal-dependent hydrolase (beta-lactamase superfamily II)